VTVEWEIINRVNEKEVEGMGSEIKECVSLLHLTLGTHSILAVPPRAPGRSLLSSYFLAFYLFQLN